MLYEERQTKKGVKPELLSLAHPQVYQAEGAEKQKQGKDRERRSPEQSG
jgi:hypothetical protein